MSDENECRNCGYRINPEIMKEAGDISMENWESYQTNPVESWCDYFRKMVPDSNRNCPHWISQSSHDSQMIKYGI